SFLMLLRLLRFTLFPYTTLFRSFRKLLDKRDRKVFDEMLSIPRFYNSAGTMTCRPVLIHVVLMSIIFEHYKQLRKIVNERIRSRSEEHTSELQSRSDLVCRLLLE